MLNMFQWVSFVSILGIALVAGYFPLFRRDLAIQPKGFPLGQAFTSGVFLGLSQAIMLPNGIHLFSKAYPGIQYHLAAMLAIAAFVILLAIGQTSGRNIANLESTESKTGPAIPVLMTVMIAIPSFLLGTALGVSALASAVLVFVAIIAHKGSAGFALALNMVRSTLTKTQTFFLYGIFAFSTPLGILFGATVHNYLTGHTMLIAKAIVLSLASGLFLYLATLHELRDAPLIVHCRTMKGFTAMLAGFAITMFAVLVLGLAHSHHHP